MGSTETYDPGDSFGWDNVSVIIDPLHPGTINADVQNQCTQDEKAWNLPLVPCQLMGIEIGSEGFHVNQIDTNWNNVTIVDPPFIPQNITDITNTTNTTDNTTNSNGTGLH